MNTSLRSSLAGGLLLLAHFAFAEGIPELKPALVHGFSAGIVDFRNGLVAGPGGNYYGVSESGGRFGHGTLFEVTPAGATTIKASFGEPETGSRGRRPIGQLVYDGSTYFYGVTASGGRFGEGTVFRATTAGVIETLVDFSGTGGAAPGIEPITGLTFGTDGNLYGALDGGPLDKGPGIYRVSTDGRYQFLSEYIADAGGRFGHAGISPMLARPDGTLLGVSSDRGTSGNGLIYRVNADGTVTKLFSFTGNGGALPGANPYGQPIAAPDGTIYGIGQSQNGVQTGNAGFIWKIDPAGTASILAIFGFDTGPNSPRAPLAFDTNGDLLVACSGGGTGGRGGVFRVTPAGAVTVVSQFDGSSGETVAGYLLFGLLPESSTNFLTATNDEIVRVPVPGAVDVIALTTPDAGTGLGVAPNSAPVFTSGGTLNALTVSGGQYFRGTVVKYPPAGAVSLLAALPADSSTNNGRTSSLALDLSNNVLITDQFGGGNGLGRILQITQAGVLTTRAIFTDTSSSSSIFHPVEGLAFDGSSSFFGLGYSFTDGGDGPDAISAYRLSGSTITRINPASGVPLIGSSNDRFSGPLVPFGDGQHYLGVLEQDNGPGKIFRLGMGGNVVTLHNFSGSPSGSVNPIGPVLAEPGGSFLVPAVSANNEDIATIVRITNTGKATKIGQLNEPFVGEHLLAPLARDSQGRIYGVTEGDVLYRVETDGTTRVLYRFPVDTSADNSGSRPSAGLTFNPADGAIYGVTSAGGPSGGGTIFKIFTAPQAAGSTQLATNVLANSTTLVGQLANNGYNVEYWFSYGTDSLNLDNESARLFSGGFHGTQSLTQAIAGLKGHRTYYVQFRARVGFGADALDVTGASSSFVTPNGAPLAFGDTILVTSANIGDSFPGDVLDNDVEPDDDPLTIQSFTQGAYGTVTQEGNTLKYTPTQAFFDNGSRDTFTYTIKDDQVPALTATATVNVLTDIAIVGEYAGLLFDDPTAAAIPREPALVPSADQIAAGFAQLALSQGRRFTARFQIGGKSISTKGTMEANRGTRISADRGRFTANLRTTPAGAEARITFNGRTLILRAGQAFAAVPGATRPASDFTMRFDPTEVADPVTGDGRPAGSGFAVVRQGASARARLVGALPDGTGFTAKSIIDPDGRLPFQTLLSNGKAGTLDGELIVDTNIGTVEPVVGTTTHWTKAAQARTKRFPSGFVTKLTPFGGKYTVPAKNKPVLDLTGGELLSTFDRGGLFTPLSSSFTFSGAKAVVVAGSNDARATAVFDGTTGFVNGTFNPAGKPVKYRGAVIQRDKTVAGFFLGTADAGSVEMRIVH